MHAVGCSRQFFRQAQRQRVRADEEPKPSQMFGVQLLWRLFLGHSSTKEDQSSEMVNSLPYVNLGTVSFDKV
jgi:hypothetical protein